jgi:hypothetical protein
MTTPYVEKMCVFSGSNQAAFDYISSNTMNNNTLHHKSYRANKNYSGIFFPRMMLKSCGKTPEAWGYATTNFR